VAADEFLGVLHKTAALLLAALLTADEFLGVLYEATALLLAALLLAAGEFLGVLHKAAALLLTALLATGEFLGVLRDFVHESSPLALSRSCRPGRVLRPGKAPDVSAVLTYPS